MRQREIPLIEAFNFAILLEPAEISPAAAFAIYLFQQNGLGYHVLVGEFDKDFEITFKRQH